MDENENIITVPEEDDALMPDGYAEGDDFFDDANWTGGQTRADEPGKAEGQNAEEGMEADDGAAPTTEQADDPDDSAVDVEGAPTTEQTAEATGNKLKFTARVDRADLDVEVDESELPTLYQKAQVTDRVQAKLAKLTPQVEKAERLARAMGFDTVDAMLASAETSYFDSEVARLVGDGVHEEVAKDMVARRVREREETAAEPVQAAVETETVPAARDFGKEVQELLSARGDLVGTTIPSEVVNACVRDGKRLIVAYSEYEERQTKAENERLAKRVKVLEQNAAAAARSPVVGVSGGGPTDTDPEDDFLKGFNSDDY